MVIRLDSQELTIINEALRKHFMEVNHNMYAAIAVSNLQSRLSDEKDESGDVEHDTGSH